MASASTGAMHYGSQIVSDDIHQHSRHLYSIQHRLQDSGTSPRSEEAKSPRHEVRSPEPDFHYNRDDVNVKRFKEDVVPSGCSPRRTSNTPPQNTSSIHNSGGKTSFCIDALLGKGVDESSIKDHQNVFRSEPLKYNERLDNTEDETSVDVDRTGSASPGSNVSRSPASSPPISPGSEDPNGNGVVQQNQNSVPSPYGGVNHGVVRQNQGLILHPGGPLIHPGGLYYHPGGGSAFHSIHKEGQPVGHPQSGGPHPQQHHIHPLQLEWLARTGMLYPRLPADLVGESFVWRKLIGAV